MNGANSFIMIPRVSKDNKVDLVFKVPIVHK